MKRTKTKLNKADVIKYLFTESKRKDVWVSDIFHGLRYTRYEPNIFSSSPRNSITKVKFFFLSGKAGKLETSGNALPAYSIISLSNKWKLSSTLTKISAASNLMTARKRWQERLRVYSAKTNSHSLNPWSTLFWFQPLWKAFVVQLKHKDVTIGDLTGIVSNLKKCQGNLDCLTWNTLDPRKETKFQYSIRLRPG